WSSVNRQMTFMPEIGDVVRIRGELDFYGPFGKLSLLARTMERSGEGELLAKFLALKKKLSDEGLFAQSLKRHIPLAPRAIGIIAGANTAALKDAVTRLEIQAPYAAITIYPALVQGAQAVKSIIQAIYIAQSENVVSVLLLIRGGGSLEDLWCFNDEHLARAIRASTIPIVTGIGHSTDETIADYVADLWCQTPTQAANAVGTDKKSLLDRIDALMVKVTKYLQTTINTGQNIVGNASAPFGNPETLFESKVTTLQGLYGKLSLVSSNIIQTLHGTLSRETLNLQHSMELENLQSSLSVTANNLKIFTDQFINNKQLSLSYARPTGSVSIHIQEDKAVQAHQTLNSTYRQCLSSKATGLVNLAQSMQSSGTWLIRTMEQQIRPQLISSEDLLKPYQEQLASKVSTLKLSKPKPENSKIRQMAALLSSSGELSITRKVNALLNIETRLSNFSSKKILQMGYAQVSNKRGFVVSVDDVRMGEDVTVRLADGSFVAQVKAVKPNGSKA
ncbi:MAG: exodeoxyribonuclease VII large subunit, partial [Burkholderiales bacterium]|nr:exodeoxyribonuclease VII large subunit [Burkholderiales bacterium]